MATLTETIREKLCTVDPAGLDDVFHEYSHSKGPLYIALAQATGIMTERLKAASEKSKAAETLCHERQGRAGAAEKELSGLKQAVAGKTKELAALDGRVKERKALLDQAKSLAGLGFGPEDLSHLRDILAEVAGNQGTKLQNAVAVFFEKVSDYQKLVSLETEIKGAEVAAGKAKAETEYWQAQAQAAAAKTKAHKITVDLTEKLLNQGVKEGDFLHWVRILNKAGVAPEALADELDKLASLEKVCQDREKHVQKLDSRVNELTSQVKALTAERQEVTASIAAVREKALSDMEVTSKKALESIQVLTSKAVEATALGRQEVTAAIEAARHKALGEMASMSEKTLVNMDALMNKAAEYAALERVAGQLEQDIVLARAFRTGDPETWTQVPRSTALGCLVGLLKWTRALPDHNPSLTAPPRSLASKGSFFSWERVTLDEVLTWGLSGLLRDEHAAMVRS